MNQHGLLTSAYCVTPALPRRDDGNQNLSDDAQNCLATFVSLIFPINSKVRDRLIASETISVNRKFLQ